ncbi:MAG TPA: hypothetical protein PKM94_10855, partial [candidate division Zixibacteria bacterium]|nr:hypothetical protein [candidate division Zixibacteria bacterium]
MRAGAVSVGAAAAAIALSCGGPGGAGDETAAPPAPAGVIVEQVIAGEVLGLPLQSPWGLAAGTDDNVYCVDRGNNRIIKFSRALQPIRDAGGAGSEAGLLSRPGYAAVDNQLNVWVADEGNQRISRFNSDLLFVDATEFYNADDPLQFGEPGGVAVSAHGELWAGDRQR